MARYNFSKNLVTNKNVDPLYFAEQALVILVVLVNIYILKTYETTGLFADRYIFEFFTGLNLILMLMEIPIIALAMKRQKEKALVNVSVIAYLFLHLGVLYLLTSDFMKAVQA